MDRDGMELIENHSLQGFLDYIKDTKNTICGRNPIQLLLAIIEEAGADGYQTKFIAYKQSEQLKSKKGSSVSYASSLTVLKVWRRTPKTVKKAAKKAKKKISQKPPATKKLKKSIKP